MFQQIFSNPFILGFVVVMIILASVDFKTCGTSRHRDFKSAIVSIGILGTFLGIFIGLYNFQTDDVARSVPQLLEGLKLAFATSIAGLSISILLFVWQKYKAPVADDDVGLLTEISRKLDHLEVINQSTNGIHAQFRELRVDLNDEQKRLRRFIEENFEKTNKSLEKAIETLSKGATAEIIKSLEVVIEKFNTELQKQFGENFTLLNESVMKLLTWQENYRSHVESSERLLQEITTSLNSSKEAFDEIVSKSKDTQDLYDNLSVIIKTFHHQTELLNQQLQHYATLGEKAESAFEVLDEGFKSINSDIDHLTREIKGSVTGQSESLSKLSQDLNKQLPEALGELEKTLVGLTRKFGTDYEAFLQRLNTLTRVT